MFNHITTNLFLLALLIALTNASGSVEVIITSPNNAYVAVTICTRTQCNEMDSIAPKIKLTANVPLKLEDGKYDGAAPSQYDFHLEVLNKEREKIGSVFQSPESNTDWQSGIIKTSSGFNATYRFRTVCDKHYFGSQCTKYCKALSDVHTVCSKNGDLKCANGWTGANCETPICSSNCSKNGKCVAPEQCICSNGFRGPDCSQCIPKPGCLHGSCFKNQSYTCECHEGYGGELCNVNLVACQREQPCQNGGICTNDAKHPSGYQCQCPQGFVGSRCDVPIDSVKCQYNGRQSVCLNGGTCFSLDEKSMECKCPSGFYGKQCEHRTVSVVPEITVLAEDCDCRNGGVCHVMEKMFGKIRKPYCECAKCYKGEHCEILDTDCLLHEISKHVPVVDRRTVEPQQVQEESSTAETMLWILLALVLIVFCLIIYVLVTLKSRRRKPTEIEMVETPTKISVTKSSNLQSRQSTPPPAYSPPRYESLATTDSLEGQIVQSYL